MERLQLPGHCFGWNCTATKGHLDVIPGQVGSGRCEIAHTHFALQMTLLVAALARIAFVPLLLMCNLAPNNRTHQVGEAQ